jgi:hypothetical protein
VIRAALAFVIAAALVPNQDAPRFTYVDLVLHSPVPLAAWQVELADAAGRAKIVGVEGGEPAVYAAAPFYDPAALQQGRIIVAAYTTEPGAPSGRVRVARIHFETNGDPDLAARLVAAAGPGGDKIADARVELVRPGGGK